MKKTWIVIFLLLGLVLALAGCQTAPESTGPLPPAADCHHRDADKDDYCDLCRGYVIVELDLLAINDLHGKFLDSSSQPGVDELSTYLESQGSNTILISSGDMWQGSSESNLTQGALVTEWMNTLGFVSMTLGNHEFDWGEEYIAANEALADFPFLAINIYDKETNALVDYCAASVVVERGGVQVGIIGAIGDCYSSISGDKTEDIYFKTGDDLTALVKAEATRLRNAGADIIVYSLHDGYGDSITGTGTLTAGAIDDYYDVSLSQGYVDLVLEGHTHQRYVYRDTHGVYHLQGGGENRGISHAEVFYNLATGTVTQVKASHVSNKVYDSYDPHPSIETLIEKYQSQISLGDQIVGAVDRGQSSTDLAQLVAKLYYETGMERWGKDYDIVLAGGLIATRNPYDLAAGQVKYSQLQSLLPFDNQLVLCSVQGEKLREKFFESRHEDYHIYYEAYGQQVWQTLDPNKTYYLITDTYTSVYGPNELTEIARYDETTFARDLLAEYIRQGFLQNDPVPESYTLTDIPTLLEICAGLVPGGVSQESYFVKGAIRSIASTKYGNMTIQDENGNTIYVYGTYDRTGTVGYGSMSNPPKVGDTVVLWGLLKHYAPQSGPAIYEMMDARILEIS